MADNKDLKKFRGGIRLESTTAPANAETGALYFDSTSKGLKVHDGSQFNDVGSGSSGGLDTFYVEDFRAQILDVTNSGDTKFIRSGSSLSFETDSDEISEKTLKITVGTSNTDYLKSPLITLNNKQKGKTCSISFYYKTDSTYVDGDMKLEVYNDSETTALLSVNIKKNTDIKKMVDTFTIPSSASNIHYRFKSTVTNGGSKYVYVDDVEMSQDPFVQADLGTITEWTVLTGQQSLWSHSTNMNVAEVSYRRVGSNVEVQFLSTWDGTAGGSNATHLKLSLPAGLTMDTSVLPELEGKAVLGSMQMYETSSPYQHPGIVTYKTNTQIMFVDAEGNDHAEDLGANGTSISGSFSVPVQGWGSTNSHIITPAKSNLTNWASYTPTGSWDNTTYQGQWRRVGDSMELSLVAKCTGTVSGTNDPFTITIPSGYTIDTNKLNNALDSTQENSGYAFIHDSDSASDRRSGKVFPHNSTTLQVIGDGMGGVHGDAPFTWVSGDHLTLSATVPITEWSAQDSNFLAALPMTKWQKKQISGGNFGSDGFITDLQFSNLDKNKSYKLTAHAYLGASANSTGSKVEIFNGGTNAGDTIQNNLELIIHEDTQNSADAFNELVSLTIIFSPKSDGDGTLKFKAELGSGSDFVGGYGRTYATLEELNMHEEVDIW